MTGGPGQVTTLRKRETPAVQREFLPAAMELEATPASPLGRTIVWVVCSLFVFAVMWSFIGKVDVIAIADGTIMPDGKLRTVQPALMGVVREIRVDNGDFVQAGTPLIILDSTLTTADVSRLRESIRKRAQRIQRLDRFASLVDQYESEAEGVRRISLAADDADLILGAQWGAFRTMDLTLLQQQRAREGELAAASALVHRLEKMLPIMQERVDAVNRLQRQGMAARMQWLELEQGLVDATGQLESERHRLHQLRAEIAETSHRRAQLRVETLRDSLTELEQLTSEAEELSQDLAKASELDRQQVLSSPVAGTVHELQVNTLGAVVQAGQTLMNLVPDGEDLVVEAWVLNRDIGFVREGQSASIKVHTFQFTKYGTVPGEVLRVSRDAVVDERAGPRYLARIRLERDWMDVSGERMNLAPGMVATAEISIGRRRLIEFFAAPLVAALDEAGRER